MSLIFSRQCEYALQALLFLALKPGGEMTSAKDLTRRLGIPYHFLGKILQDLARKGLLTSLKGPTGGFALALPPENITLIQIVDAVDGTEFGRTCVLGFPRCSEEDPCSVHDQWGKLRDGIQSMLQGKSLAQLAREMKKAAYSEA